MKKTLEELMDENPDTPHEEIAKIYSEQPDDAPEVAVQPEQAPVAPEQQLNEAQQYQKNSADAKTRVEGLYGTRAAKETALGGQIEAEEDDIRNTRQTSGTESALLAGGKVMAGTLGNILGYDSKPQVGGFEDAQKAVAGRADEARQRREYLQQRLYRANDATKMDAERTAARSAANKQVSDEALELPQYQTQKSGLENKTAENRLNQLKNSAESDSYDASTVYSDQNKKLTKMKLEAKAKAGGPNADIYQKLVDEWGQIDDNGQSIGIDMLPPAQMDVLLKDRLKADKDGTKYSFKQFEAGPNTGYGTFDENTGTFTKIDEGVRPVKTSSVNGSKQDDKDLKELAKRSADANSIIAGFEEVEKITGPLDDPKTLAKNQPGVSIPGVGRVNMLTPKARELSAAEQAILNPIANANFGASQTGMELKRQALEFQNTRFNNEQDRMKALARIKKLWLQTQAEIKAGFNPGVVELYENRRAEETAKVNSGGSAQSKPASKKSWRDLVGGN